MLLPLIFSHFYFYMSTQGLGSGSTIIKRARWMGGL